MNIALLRPDSPYGHAGKDRKFNRDEMQTALFSNESLTADILPELLRPVMQRLNAARDGHGRSYRCL